MAMYYEGYSEHRQRLMGAELEELLGVCDSLYGRDGIENETDLEEVRAEALRQLKIEYTDTSSREYDQVQFYTQLHKAMRSW